MNDYYVYVLLDPRKPGKHNYGKYTFEYEPFYIGKGRLKRLKQHYNPGELSKNTLKNTKIKAIINAGLKPLELLIYENISEQESLDKEKELISLIGRLDIKTGILTNMTVGGDGVSGYIATDELKSIRSKNGSGTGNSFFGKQHNSDSFKFISRPVYQLDLNNKIIKEFKSIADAARETNSNDNHIRSCCKGRRPTHNGFKWKYVNDDNILTRNWKSGGESKKVLQLDFDTEEVIKEWDSITQASIELKLPRKGISKVLGGFAKSTGGFKWKYKD